MPPRQVTSLKACDCVGWLSTLTDEAGHQVRSEKLLDVTISNGKVVKAGNQFGLGKKAK